jgi:hypothetical protein
MLVRITAIDNAGNTASDTSDAVFTLTASNNWNTVEIISGDQQTGNMSTALTNELKVRVGNGAGTYAGAGDVTVTFTIASFPNSSAINASGQALSDGTFGTIFGGTSTAKTASTDANGYASVIFTLGDRAGEYTVTADFTGNTSGIKTFTATERELFKATLSSTNLNMNLNPGNSGASSTQIQLSITTNAISYQIEALPNQWPTDSVSTQVVPNWDGALGFGWDNNGAGTSGGVVTTTAWTEAAGNPAATTIYTCAGDTCQALLTPTVDLSGTVDYLLNAGTYSNNVIFRGANLSF